MTDQTHLEQPRRHVARNDPEHGTEEQVDLPVIMPCPFDQDHGVALIEIDVGLWVVHCRICNAMGPHENDSQTKHEAISRWNARAF
jgi:hypothetical protein